MDIETLRARARTPAFGCFLLVLVLAFFTYFWRYSEPQAVFWDENYHIASAQKYLNGIYFMEQHPPLGKLLIALGEKVLNANTVDNAFINTDYATNFPGDFSFAGYRFFPALLGWLTAGIIYCIFLVLLRKPLWAVLLSFLYVFDNALIVHLRGAMLESMLLFFEGLTILLFLLLLRDYEEDHKMKVLSLWFGVALAAVFTTKLLGLVMILLVPVILWELRRHSRALKRFIVVGGTAFLLTYIAVWHTHFALGRTVHPSLPDSGFYQASEAYKGVLVRGGTRSLGAFPVMIRDSWKFVSHYNRGTPRLDLCKMDENGSPFYFWPVGARSISYRWETPNGVAYKYLYLQSNPVVWWGSSAAVLLALCLIVGGIIGPPRPALKHGFLLMIFTGIYVSYMLAISRIDRVMYLYHYFTPLFIGFIVTTLVIMELDRIGRWRITEYAKTVGLLSFATLIVGAWQFYRPFTYYEPLTKQQFERRAFFSLWELQCVTCPRKGPLATPVPRPSEKE